MVNVPSLWDRTIVPHMISPICWLKMPRCKFLGQSFALIHSFVDRRHCKRLVFLNLLMQKKPQLQIMQNQSSEMVFVLYQFFPVNVYLMYGIAVSTFALLRKTHLPKSITHLPDKHLNIN